MVILSRINNMTAKIDTVLVVSANFIIPYKEIKTPGGPANQAPYFFDTDSINQCLPLPNHQGIDTTPDFYTLNCCEKERTDGSKNRTRRDICTIIVI